MNTELILSQYQTLYTIHQGPTNAVFLVRHCVSGALFIKKVIAQYDLHTYLLLKSHPELPGIPRIYFYGVVEENLVVIEDYIHGQTLETLCHNGPLSPERVQDIALDLCEILSHLHHLEPPIIHRDIKPANIMITDDAAVKLIDFNAARQYKPDQREDTVKLGTAGYAAPEQFGFTQTDCRSDVYSMGVLINVMLTGTRPNKATAEGPFAPVICRATSLDPQGRYGSVEELAWAIRRLNVNPVAKKAPKTVGVKKENPWRLPGFRTGTPWKMVLAILGYGLIISLSSTITSSNSEAERVIMDISFFLICFTWVLFLFNYQHLRDRFPLMQAYRPLYLRLIGSVLWCGAIFFFYLLLGTFIVVFFINPTSLHS